VIIEVNLKGGHSIKFEADWIAVEIDKDNGHLAIDLFDSELTRLGWHAYNARTWTHVGQIAPPSKEVVAAIEALDDEPSPGKTRIPNY